MLITQPKKQVIKLDQELELWTIMEASIYYVCKSFNTDFKQVKY